MTAATNARRLRVSVVLATYNRLDLLKRLLGDLSRQTLDPRDLEVIVVDDGSAVPVKPQLEGAGYPFTLTAIEQSNAGPAAARHRGVLHAQGDILVLLDDDMELPPRFLEEHLAYHASGRPTAVFGRYVSDPNIRQKPIFERYLGRKWDELSSKIAEGTVRVDGTMLATGNASMRREDYLRAGGLDLSLPRAEDVALGLALEEIGVHLVFSDTAYSVHLSDHTQPEKFRGRVYVHGQLEPLIARKHPTMPHADPWRFAFSLPALGRVVCLSSIIAPTFSEKLAGAVFEAAIVADTLGFERTALRGVGLVFGLEYFRGMRDQAGSLRETVRSCLKFVAKAAQATQPVPGLPRGIARTVSALVRPRSMR